MTEYIVLTGDMTLVRKDGLRWVNGTGIFESIIEARQFASLDYDMHQTYDEDDLGPYPDLIWNNQTGTSNETVFGTQYRVTTLGER